MKSNRVCQTGRCGLVKSPGGVAGLSASRLAIFFSLLMFSGCTFSPISGKQVTSEQLDREWHDYQVKESNKQESLQMKITDADRKQLAGRNSIQVGFWNQVLLALQSLDETKSSGAATTTATALAGAAGIGLGLHNLRLNRKIANPEVPFDDTEPGNQQIDDPTEPSQSQRPPAQPSPDTPADAALAGVVMATQTLGQRN